MKRNYRRKIKDKQHHNNYLNEKIMDRELGVVSDNWVAVHHGPGQEGFRKAKRGSKKFGHAKVRNKLRDTLIEETKSLNSNQSLKDMDQY